jgi:ABC-2 type transport system permease protein
MIGLLLKDLYILRQYLKTMLIMAAFFALISAGLDNPAAFFSGVIVLLCVMMTITSFSYDALANWERYALSMPVTRKEVVASKYLLALILCLAGAVISFPVSLAVLKITGPVEGFGMSEHLYSTVALICIAYVFVAVLLPLIFKFGVEKCRIFMIAVFAAPTAAVIALSKAGIPMPSEDSLKTFIQLLPVLVILLNLASYFISVRIFKRKEI